MLLGALLRQLQDERFAQETLFALGDVTLAGRVAQAGARFGETAAAYAAGACARFSDGASDEDWLALMTALERGSDPAATCLRTMIDWSLKQDAAPPPAEAGCGCGGGGGCGGHDHGPG
ncbi:hypothetical protein [Xanthobacter oligotrophicus]|uniref:hypothetical protein n=1 Tax=Xanthobacter oligotrophicus TaxID=2607286 RepID=UPI0011F23CAB|nr:hypothetical protein [Xanthobacter oligotrophicus]MCG5234834.1 hypothetical protein [Xanthobacter oligotrophicus]